MTKDKIPEWAGAGINGAPSFQGVAYGYGGRAQLAGPPRPLPDDFEKIVDDLVADEMDDMFGGATEPVWTRENTLRERNQSDQFYRDLPGWPAVNTLVAKKDFVPVDAKAVDDVDWLGPTVNGVALNDVPNNTASNWKATTPEKRGKQMIDINALVQTQELPEGMISANGRSPGGSWHPNVLVAPKDWEQEREENATGDIEAMNPIGGMGVVRKPQMFVPDSAENQMPTAWRESIEKPIINREEKSMATENLVEMIRQIVLEELEEAEIIPSTPVLSLNKAVFDDIIARHGGDYTKASQSPEWQQALQAGEQRKEKETVSQIAGVPLPGVAKNVPGQNLNMNQRLQALKPSAKKPAPTGPTGPTGTSQVPDQQRLAHNAKISAMKSKYAKPGAGTGMGESVVVELVESIIDEILAEVPPTTPSTPPKAV